MKATTSKGTTTMWYAVDKDGRGKLYTYKPERHDDLWLSHIRDSAFAEPEPDKERLILPNDAKALGRTWEDEPCLARMIYDVTIIINE